MKEEKHKDRKCYLFCIDPPEENPNLTFVQCFLIFQANFCFFEISKVKN